ncbi:MAG: 16S rRNA (cytosine(1402)-N(4))-methyltransferase RsmH [Flavobacteriaceae bacterium]|jgi:16S rRNA (cytosine1402-N4)-methyltransferase|nr:16S rRNA (cytosine(1402)-N(4))-methyltransferase RsmH [Flavobacteriaceae bacterium]MDG1973624.1 16S rRNA (cytosine(1402)-N(4))-methyltransferase RsmH [Flavobacteriaceae bacterium]
MYHNPVMLNETIKCLEIKKDGAYVDLTFGGGGHSKAILNFLSKKGKLIAFDQDLDAIENKIDDERLLLLNQNFKFLKQNLNFYGYDFVDGVLADLGVSSFQFDSLVRGFSIRKGSNLDMRMNKNGKLTASEILNNYSEKELSNIFFEYSDLRNSRSIAKLIVEKRNQNKIISTEQFNKILNPFLSEGYENKTLAKIYQALRIEVNDEMESLKKMLVQLPSVLKKGGKIVIITYHSVEDRIVKRFIQNGCFDSEPLKDDFGKYKLPFKKSFKYLSPSLIEIKKNSRSRSAKLRSAIRI